MAPAPKTAPSPQNSSRPPPSDSAPPPTRSPPSPPPPTRSPPPSSPPPRSPPPSSPPPRSPPPSSPPHSPPPPSSSKPPKGDGDRSSPPPPSSSSKGSPPSPSPPPQPQTPPSTSTSPGAFVPPPHKAVSNQSPPAPTSKLPKSPSHKTPPRSSGGSYRERSNTSNEAIIIGLALAAFLFLALVIICVTCTRRKRKQKVAAYYMNPPPGATGGGGGDYYKTKNQRAAAPHEHVVKFTPPGMMGTPVGAGGGWGASPHSNMSGNFSASAFSIPPPNMPLAFSQSHFSYNELSAATGGFSQSNLLGQGGFGYVHKGILPNGKEVAVKSLKSGSKQGEREFQAEVEIISRVHHRHLVSLVGYCIADAQRILVYEYVPNKTLDFHLHGKGCPVMNWETRIRIALGSAKGLAYLHEDCDPRIIHRDIKSANILLDHNFEAKVADFGLAKLVSGEDTHISTRVMGTFGYLAPEYASSGKLTEKSDVFSFGVMLLEILTGRKPIDPTSDHMEDSLVEWAGPLLAKALEDRNYNELVDPCLEGNYEPNKVARMASCAAASIRHSGKRRPKMSQIVRALEGDGSLDSLNDVLKPQRVGSTLGSNQSPDMSTSIVYDTRAYNNDMRNFKEMVMSSQEFASS